ncbi:hypothetical protein ACFLZ8_04220 [Planctomycetota bacterium]
MNTQRTKYHLNELKRQIRETNKANDLLLLKLFVLMIFLAVMAAMINGKIQLF